MSNVWITFDDREVTVQIGLRVYSADRKKVYNKKRIRQFQMGILPNSVAVKIVG